MWQRSLVIFSLFLSVGAQAADTVHLAQFGAESTQIPAPWQVVQLNKKVPATQYQIKRWDSVLGIEARADKSMALLARPVAVDLQRTPILCWRWRVDAPLLKADLATKAGDDYAARVYVSFALPPDQIGWALRGKLALARSIYGAAVPDAAINYVWDNRYAVGTRKPNAYTDRTRMIVAESGALNAGKWIVARHDVQQDVTMEFAAPSARMIQLSVAVDTDNTGEQAHAGFADFHFVEKNAACFAERVSIAKQ